MKILQHLVFFLISNGYFSFKLSLSQNQVKFIFFPLFLDKF